MWFQLWNNKNPPQSAYPGVFSWPGTVLELPLSLSHTRAITRLYWRVYMAEQQDNHRKTSPPPKIYIKNPVTFDLVFSERWREIENEPHESKQPKEQWKGPSSAHGAYCFSREGGNTLLGISSPKLASLAQHPRLLFPSRQEGLLKCCRKIHIGPATAQSQRKTTSYPLQLFRKSIGSPRWAKLLQPILTD